ncbi:MAG TPA: hypothetical protein VFR37_07960 [Longimicrobium sp.]|nr:hypothetical protein [Longimicrobium sp.]
MHTETGHILRADQLEELRRNNPALAAEYAPLPRRLERAAGAVLARGDDRPNPAVDKALTAHQRKLLKKRRALEKAGRKAARSGPPMSRVRVRRHAWATALRCWGRPGWWRPLRRAHRAQRGESR